MFKNTFTFIAVSFLTIILSTQVANAQGCVAVRQMGGVIMCSSNSYNIDKGDFNVGVNYRYFHSWRHFIGTEEQPQRQTTGGGFGADGVERGDAVNIYSHAADLNFSYGLTRRLQINATLPYVNNERSQVLKTTTPKKDTFRYSIFANGLADIRLSVNYWVFDPLKAQKGNLMLGLGVKLNNGTYDATYDTPQSDGTIKKVIVDQAIQPGDGGIGVSVEFNGFREITKSIYGFANGYYLFNPKQSNGAAKSSPKAGLEGYEIFASPDQYFLRGGFMTAVGKEKNINLSLAGRWEGIPAYDAFGGQVAYRRPGYVVAVEAGVSVKAGNSTFSLFVPYNFIKNRIQSAADIASQNLQNATITDAAKLVHVQGDAAFADYSISLGYNYRINTMKKGH